LGILAGAPAAALNYWLTKRSANLAAKQSGMASIYVAMKWSLARLGISAAALMLALPFGQYVVIGVFITLAVEMIIYIGRLWIAVKNPVR
ncbi:MAG: hypothetical protein WC340_19280, partial [Kiritimatiellia bacterium]